jgi:hypothetical protein
VSALNQNSIFARWLQRRMLFVADDGTHYPGSRALGPDRQLLPFSSASPLTGKFEVYAEDGVTLLGTSATQTITVGQSYRLR